MACSITEKATGLNCGRNGHDHSMKAEQLVNLINNSLKKDSLTISEKEYLNKDLRALEKVIQMKYENLIFDACNRFPEVQKEFVAQE